MPDVPSTAPGERGAAGPDAGRTPPSDVDFTRDTGDTTTEATEAEKSGTAWWVMGFLLAVGAGIAVYLVGIARGWWGITAT